MSTQELLKKLIQSCYQSNPNLKQDAHLNSLLRQENCFVALLKTACFNLMGKANEPLLTELNKLTTKEQEQLKPYLVSGWLLAYQLPTDSLGQFAEENSNKKIESFYKNHQKIQLYVPWATYFSLFFDQDRRTYQAIIQDFRQKDLPAIILKQISNLTLSEKGRLFLKKLYDMRAGETEIEQQILSHSKLYKETQTMRRYCFIQLLLWSQVSDDCFQACTEFLADFNTMDSYINQNKPIVNQQFAAYQSKFQTIIEQLVTFHNSQKKNPDALDKTLLSSLSISSLFLLLIGVAGLFLLLSNPVGLTAMSTLAISLISIAAVTGGFVGFVASMNEMLNPHLEANEKIRSYLNYSYQRMIIGFKKHLCSNSLFADSSSSAGFTSPAAIESSTNNIAKVQ